MVAGAFVAITAAAKMMAIAADSLRYVKCECVCVWLLRISNHAVATSVGEINRRKRRHSNVDQFIRRCTIIAAARTATVTLPTEMNDWTIIVSVGTSGYIGTTESGSTP